MKTTTPFRLAALLGASGALIALPAADLFLDEAHPRLIVPDPMAGRSGSSRSSNRNPEILQAGFHA